jgi:preprotein translocase SecF subunit
MFMRGREVKFNLIGGRFFSPPNIYWFAFSFLLIIVSIVALLTIGINWGIEFSGGYLVKVELEKPADVGDVRGMLGKYTDQDLEKSIVQTAEDGVILTLRMPYIEDSQTRKDTISAVKSELDENYGIKEVLEEEQVGSEWGREISTKALIALAVFLVVILIYITFRLELKMAVAAILALIHDTFIAVGIFALTQRQVNPATVIAFLTILGYSLYDTIVVFDRVDENSNLLARSGRVSYADIVNTSVNQTLMRSINTTLTTLIPIITILIVGGDTLKDFAFALFLGVLLGGYSSIFIASPILAVWKEREPRFASVREKADAKGAREAILVTSAGMIEEVPKQGAEKKTAPKKAAPKKAAQKKVPPKEAAKKQPEDKKKKEEPTGPAGEKKPKPAAAKAGQRKPAQRKKATTKGPGGGKKKKKKKKKR